MIRCFIAALALVLGCWGTVEAAEQSWPFLGWLPWHRETPRDDAPQLPGDREVQRVLGSSGLVARRPEPPLWQRMVSGVRRSWADTKRALDFLRPWDSPVHGSQVDTVEQFIDLPRPGMDWE